MQEIAKGIIAEVEKNCFQKIPRTTANEANVEKLSNGWLPNIVAERAKAQVDQVQVQEQESTENNAASFEPKISWSSVLTVSRMPALLKSPFQPILKNFLKLLKKQNRSMKRTLLSSAVQSGLGIYEVVKGVRKLRMAEVTSESRMEEERQEREEYNNERRETRQSQMEEREDGTTLILTEAKSESKQAFSSLSQNSQRFEHTETTVTGAETSASEAADLKTGANDTTSEHGFEDQVPAPEFGDEGITAGAPEADSSNKIQQQ